MELICPAGTPSVLRAAVDAGADAVYCGFRDRTNARNFPGLNFDRGEMRAGMDYAEIANVTRHADWARFERTLSGRLVLFTTAGGVRLPEARFEAGDTLLFGSESKGAPADVHERADLRVRIPQAEGTRSLNLAVAAGIGVAEGLRQTGLWIGR